MRGLAAAGEPAAAASCPAPAMLKGRAVVYIYYQHLFIVVEFN